MQRNFRRQARILRLRQRLLPAGKAQVPELEMHQTGRETSGSGELPRLHLLRRLRTDRVRVPGQIHLQPVIGGLRPRRRLQPSAVQSEEGDRIHTVPAVARVLPLLLVRGQRSEEMLPARVPDGEGQMSVRLQAAGALPRPQQGELSKGLLVQLQQAVRKRISQANEALPQRAKRKSTLLQRTAWDLRSQRHLQQRGPKGGVNAVNRYGVNFYSAYNFSRIKLSVNTT